ncbi:MAG: polyprenyl synthetase family protein [Gammaproteobacteria bacterium]|nr:polyprenyl synthetase family protein [Gammaproteobacteria bacterium]
MASKTMASLKQLEQQCDIGVEVESHLDKLFKIIGWSPADLEEDLARFIETIPGSARIASNDLLNAGGKRIRPLLALMACGATGGKPSDAMAVATAVEMLHTGTLLHDDVIDEAPLRRGKPSAHQVWGNSIAVLSGDFCIFAALNSLLQKSDLVLIERAMETVHAMVAGELIQLEQRSRDANADKGIYFDVIERKTASLFGFATFGGARCAKASAAQLELLDQYGRNLGLGFQIVDDVLDLSGEPSVVGKALGQDIKEGIVTLPVLFAIEEKPSLLKDVQLARELHQNADEATTMQPLIASIIRTVQDGDALDRAQTVAVDYTQAAYQSLTSLPQSRYKQALSFCAEYLTSRRL